MALISRLIFILFLTEMVLLALFISKAGFFAAFMLCLLSVFVGGYLIRQGGLSTLMGFAQQQRVTPQPVFDGLFVLIAGMLFIFPGFLSDILGLLLLVPTARRWISDYFPSTLETAQNHSYRPESGDIIEGEFTVVEENFIKIEPDNKDGQP